MHRYSDSMERRLASAPREVQEVFAAVQRSADEGLSPALAKQAAYLSSKEDGCWRICDNFERFCDLILEYRGGQWYARHMYGDEYPGKKISHAEALANAELFFHG